MEMLKPEDDVVKINEGAHEMELLMVNFSS